MFISSHLYGITTSMKKPHRKGPPRTAHRQPETSWGGVAHWYDQHIESAGTYHESVVLPGVLRLLAPKKGEKILDIACGEGYFTRAYHNEGVRTYGSDISSELIHIARTKSKEVTYFVAPAEDLSFADDELYDAASLILAIQNIKGLDETVSEVARILKTGGRFLLVMNHPSFRIPHQSNWQHDEKTKTLYRRLSQYMSESTSFIDMNPGRQGSEKQVTTVSYHRPLQQYVKAFAKHGLCIEKLEEWISDKKSQPGPRQHAEDAARKEFPLFMAVLVRKI